MSPTSDTVVHAYGVVHTDPAPSLPTAGIDGTPVTLLELDDEMSVVIGRLPADAYGEPAWAKRGEDPLWLEPIARAHHAVLQALTGRGDVLPLRLPGIYPDEQAARAALEQSRDSLAHSLRFVSGHTEWSVHVFLTSPAQQEVPTPVSGRDYLQLRKQQGDDRATTRQRRQQVAIHVYEELDRAAQASVVNLPQDRALSGRDQPMLLNSAHLVPRPRESDFVAVAEELNQQVAEPGGLSIEVDGPWPPYNFTEPPSDGHAWQQILGSGGSS